VRHSGWATAAVATLEAAPAPGSGSDRDYAECFRDLLDGAVQCRLPEAGDAAILMSGGLDSTRSPPPRRAGGERGSAPPLTISWIFPIWPEPTRGLDQAANRHSGARQAIVGGDLGPLAEECEWPLADLLPDPYTRLRGRALQLARAESCAVLLTGSRAISVDRRS
jgi:hypothetical protein